MTDCCDCVIAGCCVKKCCCCIPLRIGAIIIAVLQIVGAIAYIARFQSWDVCISAICGIIAGVSLLFGAIKYHQVATIVNLVFGMVSIVFYVVAGILMIVSGGVLQANVLYGVGGSCIIVALIQLLFWIYVFSFLKIKVRRKVRRSQEKSQVQFKVSFIWCLNGHKYDTL